MTFQQTAKELNKACTKKQKKKIRGMSVEKVHDMVSVAMSIDIKTAINMYL